jgi:hypothetical protein
MTPSVGRASPALSQQQGCPCLAPGSRLRLSSRGCHGNFTARAPSHTVRGTEAGGCACRRAAIIGCHRRGGASRHNSATPYHFPPRLLFLVRLAARWAGRACRAALSPFSYHPPPPLRWLLLKTAPDLLQPPSTSQVAAAQNCPPPAPAERTKMMPVASSEVGDGETGIEINPPGKDPPPPPRPLALLLR